MDMMKEEKLKALQSLLKQMNELMIEGEGDEEMTSEDMSEAMDEAAEGPEADEGMSMAEACEEGEEDPLKEEKKKFMRGMVDRPKKPSLNIMPKKPMVAISVEKTVASPKKKKAKGKY
jgi:hypothetical protein